MNTGETYTREELDRLVDYLIAFPPKDEDGFMQYRIRGVYVSPEVVRVAIEERLERMMYSSEKEIVNE